MNNESNLVLELWDMVRDHIPTARRFDVAVGVLRAFEEYGMVSRDLHDVVDEEPYLARAFREVFEEDNDTDDYNTEEEE